MVVRWRYTDEYTHFVYTAVKEIFYARYFYTVREGVKMHFSEYGRGWTSLFALFL